VVVTDTFPTEVLTNITASDSGVVNPTGGTITWNLGDLAAGDSISLTVTADVLESVGAGIDDFTNTVSVTNHPDDSDPNPSDNTDSDTDILDAAPDLQLTIDDGGISTRPDGTVVYTLDYSNVGNQDATGVVITQALPANTTFDPADSTPGWVDQGGGTYTLDVGNLDVGQTGSVLFAVKVDNPLPPSYDELLAPASVADDGTNGPDANPGDNNDSDTTPIQLGPSSVYAFDSFNDFKQPFRNLRHETGLFANRYTLLSQLLGPPTDVANTVQPVPVDPIFSGLAEPGTTLVVRIYDQNNVEIGRRQVVADAAGNWLVSFPDKIIWKNPHRMTVEQVGSVHGGIEDTGFNMRRYFHPALHHSLFFQEHTTINSVFREAPYTVLVSMHEANSNPLGFDWTANPYEFAASSTNAAGR
jgi:uncharacterized repeat protein (TIGR01451 family)